MRSAPDRSYNNNYSTSPNINPYTGQQGTRTPTLNDRPPSTYQPYGNTQPSNLRPVNAVWLKFAPSLKGVFVGPHLDAMLHGQCRQLIESVPPSA